LRRSSSATRALEDSFGGEVVVVWPDAVSLAQQHRDLPRRLPVGSSARSSEGRFTSASAIATLVLGARLTPEEKADLAAYLRAL
jgi:hypothetical protein